ncbi:right-handed parallel beta-helix repeat-containing protein (plasmid) [Streptomycetaceae bacterium NBC_01309]
MIDKPGTVIDGKDIPCSVRVTADGVRITRSKVTATGQWGVYLVDRHTDLLVQDVEIVGTADCEYGVGFQSVKSVRIDVSGCSDGVKMERGASLVDSWIHDLSRGPGDHNDGVQITGGSDITIRHNRIENPRNQTSAILVGGEFGSPSNILVENNFLDGGNYTVYLDPKGSNRVIRNNVFTRNYVYGPARLDGQVEWAGNTHEDGTAVAA